MLRKKKMYKYSAPKDVSAREQRCFKRHVRHHYVDLGMTQKQAVAAAYSELRAGKLRGSCKLKQMS